jgi:hypothetical protein
MLAFDFLKGRRGAGIVAVLQLIQGGVVKIIDRTLDIRFVIVTGASAQHERQRNKACPPETTTIFCQSSAPLGPVQTSKQSA